MQVIKDCLHFLLRLVLILVTIAEAIGMAGVCYWSVTKWDRTGHARWLWLPVWTIIIVFIQGALWHFLWLRFGQRSDRHRTIAEYFAITLRHPISRRPQPWE